MDNLTHTLFAATLTRTSLGHAGRGAAAVLVLGSNAPDVDVVAAIGGALGYLDWHRGLTHGLLGIAVLGAAAAGLVWAALRWRDRLRPTGATGSPPASPAMLVALGMLAVALHIAMDLPTSYGTRALSPFDDHWYTTDWMPIIDVYLLALLAAGLALGRAPAVRRPIASIVLLLMAANYGVRAVAHERAMAAAPEVFGARLPPLCEQGAGHSMIGRWTGRPRIPPRPAAGRCLLEVAAIPTFLSPFEWRLIAQTSNAYEVQTIDLWRGEGERRRPWRLSRRVPNQWTPAVVRAAESEVARRFLSFSRYPAARSALDEDGSTTVHWRDLRFAPTSATPRASPDRRSLFSATVRISATGAILDQRLGD